VASSRAVTKKATTSAPKGVTREQVTRAAMDEFAARGYRGTSLDMVAAKIGVTRQALLHHFPSKVALLLAVLERREQQDAERFLRLATQHGWSFAELFPAIIREYSASPGLPRLYTVLAAEAVDPDHPAHAWFVGRYRRVRDWMARSIADAQAEGRLPASISPEPQAAALLALLEGLQLQALLEPGAVDVEQAVAAMATMPAPGRW
jgi:AcrR family transcriptional regulator